MAMGVLKGSGTRVDPWIIEDGWDFNELRNLGDTGAANVSFVELGGDISLSMFMPFTPIPARAFNIDGKGYAIYDISVLTTGLFTILQPTEYVRNIVLEGEILNFSTNSGLLAGTVSFQADNCVVENISGFGSITGNLANNGRVAGLIGNVVALAPPAVSVCRIRRCSFKGVANIVSTNTFDPNAIGGICNVASGSIINSHAQEISLVQCVSELTVNISAFSGTSTLTTRVGGVVGVISGSASAHAGEVISCIGRLIVNFRAESAVSKVWHFAGIIGGGQSQGIHRPTRCGGFVDFCYNPSVVPVGTIGVAGVMGQAGSSIPAITDCYGVLDIQNPADSQLPPDFVVSGLAGITSNHTLVRSFFDLDVIRRTWAGSIRNEANGRTTAQLQSRQFLESQGWVF